MFKLGWTTYLIIGLGACIIALGLLYRHSLTELGKTKEELSTVSERLTQAEEDKRALQSSLELNASKSLQDNTEREELKMQVANLQQDLKKKIPLTKNKCPVSNGNAQVNDTDDIELSPELTGLLKSAYDKSTGNSSTTTSQSFK